MSSTSRPVRLCLTPSKNESWIIQQFVSAAQLWADRVIVADQGSTDGTWEALEAFPRAVRVRNEMKIFDEAHRQQLLLRAARDIPGRRILIGLDADEALSANCLTSSDWEKIENAAPGTVLRFRWVNVLPGFKTAWIPKDLTAFGYVDDGVEHKGRRIHSPRVPRPDGAPILELDDIVVLHFQYVLWERMASKQRWYQAWEHHTHAEKGPLDIYRQYNHMRGSWGADEIVPLKPEWLSGFPERGIDFTALKCEPVTWWDREVAMLLAKYGPAHFRRIGIWEKDWVAFGKQIGMDGVDLRDPRNAFERAVHRMLSATQKSRDRFSVRILEKMLRTAGW